MAVPILPGSSRSRSTTSEQDLVAAEQIAFFRALFSSTGHATALALARHAHLLSTQSIPPSPASVAELHRLYSAFASDRSACLPGACYLGYLFETNLPQTLCDATRATACFSRCASCNSCALGAYLQAVNLESGRGVTRDVPAAARIYSRLYADGTSPRAALRLARLLDRGAPGLIPDHARAVALYEQVIATSPSQAALDGLADALASGRPGVPRSPARAARLYETSIEMFRGSHAMTGLAYLLQNGRDGVRVDLAAAVRLYEEAIQRDGNPLALNNLGLVLYQGTEDGHRDVRRAVALWEVAIAKGNKNAVQNLAVVLESGDEDIGADRARAIALYESIAGIDQFRSVRFNLAWLLSNNQSDCPQDHSRAAHLYQKIVDEQGDVHAMFNLASLLERGGSNLKQDLSRAISLYERASQEGDHACSMHRLGVLLGKGLHGVPVDVEKATELLERAVDSGRREAFFDLAIVLSDDRDGPPADAQRAAKLYEMAIEEVGHMGAMINLSEILREGKHNIPQDIGSAMRLCERAIAQGVNEDAKRLEQLGISMDGIQQIENSSECAALIRKHAVQHGWHLVALLNLAEMLLEESPKNWERAVPLFEAAAMDPLFMDVCESQENGISETFRILQSMIRGPNASRDSASRAIKVYEMFIASGHPRAMYSLAQVYENGTFGVPSNPRRAEQLYNMAIEKDEEKAKIAAGEMLRIGRDGVPINIARSVQLFTEVLATTSSNHLKREAVVQLALLSVSYKTEA